jgi:hypothetical protein
MLALYREHRPEAAWQYLDGTADLTFLESRGYVPELLSGDRLRSIDAAVPHQLFATTGFVSGLMRGLVGLREPAATDPAGALTIEPQLPAGWPYLRLRRLRWRDAIFDVGMSRDERGVEVTVANTGQARPLIVALTLPPGAQAEGNVRELRFAGAGTETKRIRIRPGIEIAPVHPPLTIGDESQRVRVIRASLEGGRYVARLQGRAGRTYRVRLSVPLAVNSIDGGTIARRDGRWTEVTVPFEPSDREWVTKDVSFPFTR